MEKQKNCKHLEALEANKQNKNVVKQAKSYSNLILRATKNSLSELECVNKNDINSKIYYELFIKTKIFKTEQVWRCVKCVAILQLLFYSPGERSLQPPGLCIHIGFEITGTSIQTHLSTEATLGISLRGSECLTFDLGGSACLKFSSKYQFLAFSPSVPKFQGDRPIPQIPL